MSRILLIEDDRSTARGLCSSLEAENHVVARAADGPAGLAKAAVGTYDLIVLDVTLPGLSGFEVLARLRERGDATPVILLSARADEKSRIRGLDLGADDFVAKPFALGELLSRIRTRARTARHMAVLRGAIAESTLDTLLESALELTGAERGLLLVDDGAGELIIEAARGLGDSPRYCRTVARRVFRTGQAEALLEADGDWRNGSGSVLDLKLRRVLCAPLRGRGRVVGVLYADSRMQLESWGAADVRLFESLASQCGLALDRARAQRDRDRLEREMRAAGSIQRAMQARPPEHGAVAVDIAGLTNPLEPAGGDYVDYIEDERMPHRLSLVMGDAAGHGVAAALSMSAARSLVRTFLPRVDEPAAVLAEVNRGFVRDLAVGNFMSLFLAQVDTANCTLRYASAGHACFVYRAATGGCETLDATGPALGLVEDAVYATRTVEALSADDVLVLFTDGVTEAMGPGREMFGVGRIEALVAAAHAEEGRAIVDRVTAAVRRFAGRRGPADDLSLMVVKGTDACYASRRTA
ncbi:MAG: SpoIIE family protein phosphatase [Planctomycetota bacterium]|nr:SpoIIE family protein phosphatase [Planctomycetota bacterium]